MLKENDCVSCPHRHQAAGLLDDGVILVVKGNECMSYLNRGQAATRLDCCTTSNILVPTFINIKLHRGLTFASWKPNDYNSARERPPGTFWYG